MNGQANGTIPQGLLGQTNVNQHQRRINIVGQNPRTQRDENQLTNTFSTIQQHLFEGSAILFEGSNNPETPPQRNIEIEIETGNLLRERDENYTETVSEKEVEKLKDLTELQKA
ncbi:10821_t:CDS:2, partial [Scutellospora calospora]